ncbi:MAG TPA: NAD-dependent deacylase [Burkholderiales bacterium]|nr:NAD-dependent deacylase [Burkholderiales bacterium]
MSGDFDPRLLRALRVARRVGALTGAGISAESGIPTFRDAQTGLWARFRPEELATAEAFRRNPQLVWDWYEWRRDLVAGAAPNAAHCALARMQDWVPDLTLVTQNVDGLHQRAGSRDVVELHGNIHRSKCFVEDTVVETWPETGARPPRCRNCGAPLRPDVVWFGESLPPAALARAEAVARECDLFFSIGTSAAVFPAAQLPVTALQGGAIVVEINKDPTPLTRAATFSMLGAAGTILPALLDEAWSGRQGSSG